jgi:2-polyprenyl-3-methyl-5-hydroxy-6-metoxy-1,4-benzoquinol methylase
LIAGKTASPFSATGGRTLFRQTRTGREETLGTPEIHPTDEQLAQADTLRWYHALEFGRAQTRGRFDEKTPPNMTLFGVMDLLKHIDVDNMRCLDVGPAHGLISFGLALQGAEVTATNIGAGKPPQIALAEAIYGVDIDYRHGVALADAGREFEPGTFDLIVCAGVMYHLLNPADAFFRLRPLLKRDGLLLLETVYAKDRDEPVLQLNSESEKAFPQVTTYFLPSESALLGLAKLACFEPLATRVSQPARYTVLCRATLPDDIPERTDMCRSMHDHGFEDPSFNLGELKAQTTVSPILYTGPGGSETIDVNRYTPDFPSHPSAIAHPVGRDFYG